MPAIQTLKNTFPHCVQIITGKESKVGSVSHFDTLCHPVITAQVKKL